MTKVESYPKWISRISQGECDGYQFRATLFGRTHTRYFGATALGGIRKAKAAADRYRRLWIRVHGEEWKGARRAA